MSIWENSAMGERVDKTGKAVTRHVKADAHKSTSAPHLPPPSVSLEPVSSIILPEHEVSIMTKGDWSMVADVLDLCGTHNGDDLVHVTQYVKDGDMDALRVFKKYGHECSFSTICDVIEETTPLYGKEKPSDYVDSIEAHFKIATSGHFYYGDIAGVPAHEGILKIIHDNPDQVGSILAFLLRRKPDPDALTLYLANEAKALREGTL
jgi:hypothetical protein